MSLIWALRVPVIFFPNLYSEEALLTAAPMTCAVATPIFVIVLLVMVVVGARD